MSVYKSNIGSVQLKLKKIAISTKCRHRSLFASTTLWF